MTVAEALVADYNNLGYRLNLLMVKTCAKNGVRYTDAITDMFINACGNEDLSSPSAYIEVERSLNLFVTTLKLSLEQFTTSTEQFSLIPN